MNTTTQKSLMKAPATPEESSFAFSSALYLMAIANLSLPDCRPLTDWERKDADEFFARSFRDAVNTERSEV
jgi:hypothetical protein